MFAKCYPRINAPKFSSQIIHNTNRPMLPMQQAACLNPKCTAPRLLTASEYQLHKGCIDWLVHPTFEQEYDMMPSLTHMEFPYVSFQELGVKSVPIMLLIRNWPAAMNNVFQEFKSRVCGEIDLLKKQKILQYQSLLHLSQQAYKEIRNISHNLDNPNYTEAKMMAQVPKFLALQQLKCFNFLQVPKTTHFFQKSVMPILRETSQLIQSVGPLYDRQNTQARQELANKYQQFVRELSKGAQIHENMQKIVNMFNVEMPKVGYQPELGLYKATCWACSEQFFAKKSEGAKLSCFQQLIMHLASAHSNQFSQHYIKKVFKCEAQEVKFNIFTKKINCQPVSRVFVIDRENAGTINRPEISGPECLWVEVVNKDNRHLAKGQFIVAHSKAKDAADTLIIMLIQQLCRAGIQEIVLVTKDHFGVTLQEVLHGISGCSIECIEPKDLEARWHSNKQPTLDMRK